ncbi:MAG: hypothetical protein LBD23_14945 [Oscillospiraceae bacterium]|jgi:hypothetical protein|nr:hypothetical protein [Oscillospiraceae bacterium]
MSEIIVDEEQSPRQFLILDDSGDPGVDGSSTSHFIIAAVLIIGNVNKQKLTTVVDQYRRELGWKETHEFKFNTTKKEIIVELINRIRNYEFSSYAMALDKKKNPCNTRYH